MGGYNQNNRSNGSRDRNDRGDRSDRGHDDNRRGSYSGNSRNYSDRDEGRPTMNRAVCDECGKSCEVPFKPSGSKPVYCSDCFERRGNGNDQSPKSFNRPSFNENRGESNSNVDAQLKEINKKLDDIIKAVYNTKTIRAKKEDKEIEA